MNCPLCIDTTLDVTFHSGIELDICPRCQGVWLDRGELQRLAANTDRPTGSRATHDNHGSGMRSANDRLDHREKKGSSKKKSSKKKRKKNFAERLGDVFEEIIDL